MRRKIEERVRYLMESKELSETEAREIEEQEWFAYQEQQFQRGKDRARGLE